MGRFALLRRMSDGAQLLLGLSGPDLRLEEAALFRRLQPAGYMLLPHNIVAPAQVRKLTDDLRELSPILPILAISQEGGAGMPLGQISVAGPSAITLATGRDMGKIADAAALTATLLRMLGINLNLAPVLDLDHFPNSDNPHDCRWGRDPQRVIDYAGHWNRWQRKRGIAGCAKHFPAGGRATSDAQHQLPVCPATLAELQREDVIPYTALMPELDAIMPGHVEFPNIDADFPATFSPRIIRRFLRDQLGFDRHIVLTDDLDHGLIARRYDRGDDVKLAIQAGNDLVMIARHPETAELAARAIGELPCVLTHEARERVERFRYKSLHPPIAWSDKKWNDTCAALAAL